jgi:hypothetical protein
MQVSQPNSNAMTHKDLDEPMQTWGQSGAWIPNLKNTGGFVTFAENLVCSTCNQFSLPCADANGQPVDCSSTAKVGQLSVEIKTCSESGGHSTNLGMFTLKCRMTTTIVVKTGCTGCNLFFTNANTGAVIKVLGVHHWAWGGKDLFFFPDSSAAEFSAAFPNPSAVTVTRADYGKTPEENRALSYVFGQNAERLVSGNNGLKYINLNAGPRMRYGTGGSMRRDYTVWTINPYTKIEQGDTYAVRHYLVTDEYVGINTRAADWVSEVYQVQREAGQMQGRAIHLYSVDKTTFGATVNGSACGEATAALVCTGRTTPQTTTQEPLFAISCGSQVYVGTDLYHFSPARATDGSEVIRSYVCDDEPAGVRPKIKLLGWFPDGECAAIHNASFREDLCEPQPWQVPTTTPTSTPAPVDEVKMKVQLPYTVAEFTEAVQDQFKAGIAEAVMVAPENVVINNITAAGTAGDSVTDSRRRLLGNGIVVDFSIVTPGTIGIDKATPIQSALADVTVMNQALVKQGVASISAIVEAPVTVSSGAAAAQGGGGGASSLGKASSLDPTRDFAAYARCAEEREWADLRGLLREGGAFTGGLGGLMTREHQAYFCLKGHSCLADVGASPLDYMCYIYSEREHTFQAWGFESELKLRT